jgi:hypothetical protein
MNRREPNNRDPRRGLPSLAERRKTNIPSVVDSKKAIEHGLVTQDKHRFAIGQTVSMSLSTAYQGKSVAGEIVKLLPFEGSYYQYRVRSAEEAFERIANEHDLVAAPSVYKPKMPAR